MHFLKEKTQRNTDAVFVCKVRIGEIWLRSSILLRALYGGNNYAKKWRIIKKKKEVRENVWWFVGGRNERIYFTITWYRYCIYLANISVSLFSHFLLHQQNVKSKELLQIGQFAYLNLLSLITNAVVIF